MIRDELNLTPQVKGEATLDNYTWYNGKGEYPVGAGYVFLSKGAFAHQIETDYPNTEIVPRIGHPDFVGVGAVIGGPGFGWYGSPPKRFPHIGGVTFGDRVEIGANATIDRGAIQNTILNDDVKVDNGVHIGHNAVIGARSILTAHCVIGGSAVVGRNVWVGLGAQIKNQIVIGDDAVIGMGAIVVKDVAAGTTVVGNPARPT